MGIGVTHNLAIYWIGASESLDSLELVSVKSLLLLKKSVGPTNVHPAIGQNKIPGYFGLNSLN